MSLSLGIFSSSSSKTTTTTTTTTTTKVSNTTASSASSSSSLFFRHHSPQQQQQQQQPETSSNRRAITTTQQRRLTTTTRRTSSSSSNNNNNNHMMLSSGNPPSSSSLSNKNKSKKNHINSTKNSNNNPFSFRCSMYSCLLFVLLGSVLLAWFYNSLETVGGGAGNQDDDEGQCPDDTTHRWWRWFNFPTTTQDAAHSNHRPQTIRGSSPIMAVGHTNNHSSNHSSQQEVIIPPPPLPPFVTIPSELLGLSYQGHDFFNDAGVVPTYWNCSSSSHNRKKNNQLSRPHHHHHASSSSSSSYCIEPSSPSQPQPRFATWGPCYLPKHGRCLAWQSKVEDIVRAHNYSKNQKFLYATTHSYRYQHHPKAGSQHQHEPYHPPTNHDGEDDVRGFCRPGFIILGAGKCGTSSLYHYLVDHPRVLPAREKQIHYFKYFTSKPLRWYYAHFPTTEAFLASGALMTGEASPGYLPYPPVAALMQERMPGSRLIVLGRNPIERMYSSFVYSYIDPTIAEFRRGRISHVPANLTDDEYKATYLFSFEETIRAELNVLKPCMAAPHGAAITKAQQRYHGTTWGTKFYAERKRLGLPPPMDVDGSCYGTKVNATVLRPQWANLTAQYPHKVILDRNTHLLQSHLGRSLYVLPLEWWWFHYGRSSSYDSKESDDIFFLCTEDMKDLSGQSMEPLRQWLGLPEYNFSQTLQRGAYNVGGHRGYDKELSWDIILNQTQETTANNDNDTAPSSPNQTITTTATPTTTHIPLSPEFRQELLGFLKPYNERLFQLVGKRCRWDE